MPVYINAIWVAALLPMLLAVWFLPAVSGQLDVWILWFVAMLVLGLPLLIAEVGLARRASNTPALAMNVLTREADASTAWRFFAYLSALTAVLLAVFSLNHAVLRVDAAFSPLPFLPLAGMVWLVTLALSLIGQRLLPAAVGVLALSWLLVAFTLPSLSFAITEVSSHEWAQVVALAVVSVGAGSGLYWHLQAQLPVQQTASGTRISPIKTVNEAVRTVWVTQLVVGALVMWLAAAGLAQKSVWLYALGAVLAGAFLLHYASVQFAAKLGQWPALGLTGLISALLLLLVPVGAIKMLLLICALVAAIILAVFAGWQMKISHLRKSLNFASEGRYNLWRVAIRILVPLLLTVAIIGWVVYWV